MRLNPKMSLSTPHFTPAPRTTRWMDCAKFLKIMIKSAVKFWVTKMSANCISFLRGIVPRPPTGPTGDVRPPDHMAYREFQTPPPSNITGLSVWVLTRVEQIVTATKRDLSSCMRRPTRRHRQTHGQTAPRIILCFAGMLGN